MTYENNGIEDDRRKHWRRQTTTMVMTRTYEDNGNDDDIRKQWN